MAFFLGKRIDPEGSGDGARVEYKAKHLTTHGLVFGMTGSGKTGLCVGLLEEAAREDIPIIAIDPKGDLTNLALCWPELSGERFAEWIDPSRLGDGGPNAAAELGEKTAATWREGLAREGIDGDELRAYRARTGITIYTPGSSAGVQVSMLDRFDPPPRYASLTDEDKSELVSGVVSAILALVNVSADPLQSREYILLSNILGHAWDRGMALDLPSLIQLIDQPPFDRLGVFDLEEFFSSRRRKAFAMQLNGLIASPSFQPWLYGVPLDMDALLKRDGRGSRTSIFYIAHLDDTERMSFVSLLLDRLIGWMRAQSGTGELRALLYMDEVFGYLPPHPLNPPTKRPLLTLLKQARAYGLGTLLATQNPVDIDYKAATNAGTWFIGRLQTEQDKERILDGLMSASTETGKPVTRSEVSRRISALEGRQFLLHNAHETEQVVFHTRFVRSYLRGPMTRQEIARLKDVDFYNAPAAAGLGAGVAVSAGPSVATAPIVDADVGPESPGDTTHTPPPAGAEFVEIDTGAAASTPSRSFDALGASMLRRSTHGGGATASSGAPARHKVLGLDERFLASAALRDADLRELLGVGDLDAGPTAFARTHYRPALLAQAQVTFEVADIGRIDGGTISRVATPLPSAPGALRFAVADGPIDDAPLEAAPSGDATFAPLPEWIKSPADRERARDRFVQSLMATPKVSVPACPPLGRFGRPGESLETFQGRLAGLLSQVTDKKLGKLEGQRGVEAAIWDKQIAELKELLGMDQREMAMLREQGDARALEQAQNRARFRMERYKELRARRDKFLGLHDRGMADVEFSALDHLAACTMVELTLRPQGVEPVFFGVLWVPNR